MKIPEFIDPEAPDFQGQLVHIHNIKEHLDMLLFAAYAGTLDRFFREHPEVKSVYVRNGSDLSDNGRHLAVDRAVMTEGLDGDAKGWDEQFEHLAEELNAIRDRGIYNALDEMFNGACIERDDVMGQFRKYWAQSEGGSAGQQWDIMVSTGAKAKLESGTDNARAAVPGPRM